MLDIIKAALLGIIEGITEFLPVSSTGHLILADQFIKLHQSTAFINMFNVTIQLGAILAVVIIYFHKLNPFSPRKTWAERQATWQIWGKVIFAVLPSVVVGLLLNDWMDAHLMNWVVVAITLILYGILFILVENHNATLTPTISTVPQISYRIAFLIGCFQLLSLVPGTSRSGATILGGIFLGASRLASTEFSFFLAIPTMFGATLLKLLKFFMHGGTLAGEEGLILLTGVVVSFVTAYIAIKALLDYVKTNSFKPFGWYRIILGIVVILYFLIA